MYNYCQPIIATAISIGIGMDTMTWQKALAALACMAGVVLVSFSKKKAES